MKVFLYVQHLLGIGHLKRAAVLARALARAGCDVTVASGGMPLPGFFASEIRLVQLPPASSPDASFRFLVGEDGRQVDEAWKALRRERLLAAFREAAPDCLLVELFPFGRRQMRFELVPLLEAAAGARPRPLVACSVRDLLQPKPAREPEVLALVDRFFDRVLLHSDPRLAPFELTFAAAPRLAGKLHYTGYVVEESRLRSNDGKGEVLVSAGGGAVGHRLLETAIAARALYRPGGTWRILAGAQGGTPRGTQGVVVESWRDDFTALLANCAVSVSQAGYNTVVETLRARARSVLVPFAAAGEAEQALRARLLAQRGWVQTLAEADLEAARLAAAVDRAAAMERPPADAVDLGGAARTAELLLRWVR
ncbi:MAG: glycosyltransferase family protein [Betaproteobacteria bacterium]